MSAADRTGLLYTIGKTLYDHELSVVRHIQVLDNFYPDPDLVREVALRSQYCVPNGLYGLRSNRPCLPRGTVERISQGFGLANVRLTREPESTACFFQSLAKSSFQESFFAHYDYEWSPRTARYALVVYLSPKAPKRAGTGLFRHRETGLMNAPTASDARRLKLTLPALRAKLRSEAEDRERWELLDETDNVYNRGVLFPAHWYHSGLGYFGDRLENGRIYHAYFLSESIVPNVASSPQTKQARQRLRSRP